MRLYESKGKKIKVISSTDVKSNTAKEFFRACDVCDYPAPNPVWHYDVEDYQMPGEVKVDKAISHVGLKPGINMMVSTGGWALCDDCHKAFQAKPDTDTLIKRYLTHKSPRLPLEVLTVLLTEHFKRFIENIKPGTLPIKNL